MTETIPFTKLKDEDKVYLTVGPLGHPDVVVETTHGAITESIQEFKKMGKQQSTAMLFRINESLQIDVNQAFAEQGPVWNNYCNDVVLHYTARAYVFNEPIPAISADTMQKLKIAQKLIQPRCQICGTTDNLSRCSKCKKMYYCTKEHQSDDWSVHKTICAKLAAIPQ